MKILHTSDWHLGRPLYGRARHQEFEAFLDWLADVVASEKVDLLLVAGDVFDSTTPGNRTQELYFRFLHRVSKLDCRHVVIVGGNHDSPTLLDAPKVLLRELHVHVLGAATGDPADEVLVLRDGAGLPEAVVCAVPYLRDRDIRTVEPGEDAADKSRKLFEGVQRHYADVCALAESMRQELAPEIPLIATGHLFASGGMTVDGDGVREIYVGSLARVTRSTFPEVIDYLALGHLHVAQRVAGQDQLRYSGSPIPMGFGEATQRKLVLLVTFSGRVPSVKELPVPCFQALRRLSGDLGELSASILELRAAGSNAWLEIEYHGGEPARIVQETLESAVGGSSLEIRRIRSCRSGQAPSATGAEGLATLESLDREAVFLRCLDLNDIEPAGRPAMLERYREILREIDEHDAMAETEALP